MRLLSALVLILVLAVAGAAVFVYTGAYDIGADAPHSAFVYRLLQTARQRSIAAHAGGIAVPPLTDQHMISEGAEHYTAMCAGCHLAPGKADTEIRRGLYPKPPNLAERQALPPAHAFWIIKHGIKLTAMPAWGTSHDDAEIWNLVAFLQKLPQMTPDEYASLTANAQHDHEHAHEHGADEHGAEPAQDAHEHGGDGAHEHDAAHGGDAGHDQSAHDHDRG